MGNKANNLYFLRSVDVGVHVIQISLGVTIPPRTWLSRFCAMVTGCGCKLLGEWFRRVCSEVRDPGRLRGR